MGRVRVVGDPNEQHRRDRERIAALERELDEAHETIRQLRAGAAVDWLAPPEFGLTASEAGVLRALLGHEHHLTKPRIMDLIYAGRINEVPEIKIVDVFVCKLRRKIKPFGLAIRTVWGQGYELEPASREQLKAWGVEAA